MAATCYNLKKLLRFKAPKAIAKVKAMEKRVEKALQQLFLMLFMAIALPKILQPQKATLLKQ